MVYKLYDEEGDYIDNITGKEVNLCEAETVLSPEGINVGWLDFDTIEDAMEYFNIRKK